MIFAQSKMVGSMELALVVSKGFYFDKNIIDTNTLTLVPFSFCPREDGNKGVLVSLRVVSI